MTEVNVGIVGVGNCASSLVQGLTYYEDVDPGEDVPGLMHTDLGGYSLQDVNIVCGFDVDERKVGLDVSEAIFQPPNSARRAVDEVPDLDAPVYRAPELDGISPMMDEAPSDDRRFLVSDDDPVEPEAKLEGHDVDVLVNFLPVGSQRATERWMEACLETGTAAVNAIPVFIASDPKWEERFEQAAVPVLGDDVKSQIGATITHRVLSNLFEARGIDLEHTYQLNIGGNTDFLNLQDEDRLDSKKVSKTESVQSQLEERLGAEDIQIGPADYVPFLEDNKVAFVRMVGRGFTDAPMEIEMRLSVEDSPNSAGVVIDAVRCAKLALDRGHAGPVTSASSYFFKHPPVQYTDDRARELVESFIDGSAADPPSPVSAETES